MDQFYNKMFTIFVIFVCPVKNKQNIQKNPYYCHIFICLLLHSDFENICHFDESIGRKDFQLSEILQNLHFVQQEIFITKLNK